MLVPCRCCWVEAVQGKASASSHCPLPIGTASDGSLSLSSAQPSGQAESAGAVPLVLMAAQLFFRPSWWGGTGGLFTLWWTSVITTSQDVHPSVRSGRFLRSLGHFGLLPFIVPSSNSCGLLVKAAAPWPLLAFALGPPTTVSERTLAIATTPAANALVVVIWIEDKEFHPPVFHAP